MNTSIELYGLRRQVKASTKSHWTTEGAGSIELCRSCWEQVAKPKMRPWKKSSFERYPRYPAKVAP